MTLANAIARKINNDLKAGAPGGTLDLSTGTPEDFAPSDRTYSFAIGGGAGVPEYKRKRVTGRGIEAWLRPYFGPWAPAFVGWWVEDGQVVLDVTTVWTGTDYADTLTEAVKIGMERGERAIYDFTTKTTLPCPDPATA